MYCASPLLRLYTLLCVMWLITISQSFQSKYPKTIIRLVFYIMVNVCEIGQNGSEQSQYGNH